MTISQFSERTGLRPKVLRYYEETGLIVPVQRSENGYRQYSESQIETAQLINSLRQADVSMSSIREFLSAPPARRDELLAEWRSLAETKLLSVKVANQFLQGFDSHTRRMHLVHWDCSRTMLWFTACKLALNVNLSQEVRKIYKERVDSAAVAERAGYVRYPVHNDATERPGPEIGFVVDGVNQVPDRAWLETVPPTLFATMVCRWDMPASCKPVLSTIKRFKFESVGEPLRKVSFRDDESYTLMVPVLSNR
ncbi:MerR family transcriptional regulator [Paenibacillus tarimensis]